MARAKFYQHKYSESELDIVKNNYLSKTYKEIVALGGPPTPKHVFRAIVKLGLPGKAECLKSAKCNESYRAYSSWASMIQRCSNPRRNNFHNYGGKGISVCGSWAKFENFLSDMGEKPSGYSIDRINPSGNYCKENCRWIPRSEQNRTTSRYLAVGDCIDCLERRGNRNGRCHRCSEYFRRHGHPRPRVNHGTRP